MGGRGTARDVVVGGVTLDAVRPGVSDHLTKHCDGGPCPLHDQTAHHMRSWPQLHGRVMNLTVRECPHGALHPDPDDLRWGRPAEHAHAAECDGCCRSAP